MKEFRKKPVIIEAVQWDETTTTLHELQAAGMFAAAHDGHRDRPDECTNLRIRTLEGPMRADRGDWIIKGVKGEFYPCKPDIFERTYESADSPLKSGDGTDYKALYHELLFAVGKKHPGETRHQTALRYIQYYEAPKETDAMAAQAIPPLKPGGEIDDGRTCSGVNGNDWTDESSRRA